MHIGSKNILFSKVEQSFNTSHHVYEVFRGRALTDTLLAKSIMANLYKFHVVFSSSNLIRLDKDAFEGHSHNVTLGSVKTHYPMCYPSSQANSPVQSD